MPITINGSGTVTGISAGGLPDDCITTAEIAAAAVTTDEIAAAAVTTAKLGSSEASGLAKAWVNFDGSANTNLSGTYSQSGTTVTVTATAHGLIAGSSINVDATSGTAVDGIYTVATVTGANTFTYTAGTSLTTSGNITLLRNTIRASFNVSSITDNGTGDYTVNFTTAMVDANYCLTLGASPQNGRHLMNYSGVVNNGASAISNSTTSVRIGMVNSNTQLVNADPTNAYVAIFR